MITLQKKKLVQANAVAEKRWHKLRPSGAQAHSQNTNYIFFFYKTNMQCQVFKRESTLLDSVFIQDFY